MPVASSKFRHLGRDSQHRQALLRNLIDKLFEHEQITTTWPKAKAAQRVAEKLITLGKRNDEIARRKAQAMFYVRYKDPPQNPPQTSPPIHYYIPLTLISPAPRTPPTQTLRRIPRTLRQPTRRLHPRSTRGAKEGGSSAVSDPGDGG
jgi:ribosomal protein L17